MRIGCIIQARLNSTRLPNKVNADIGGWPMLRHVTHRLAKFDPIVAWAHDYPEIFEDDVLGRYALCAQRHGLDAIMRVTSDCPLIDPAACDLVLKYFQVGCWDYVANDWLEQTYPDGLGCEIMTSEALRYAAYMADKEYDREHVTPFLRRGKTFMKCNVRNPQITSLPKLSVDTQEDLDFVRKIDAANPRDFSLEATLEAIERVKAQEIHA